MTKRALITGITGQDGAYLAEFLLEKGYEVHGIKRRSSSFNTDRIDHLYQDPHEAGARLHLHYGDLTDATNVVRVIQSVQPDKIYNLAAQRRRSGRSAPVSNAAVRPRTADQRRPGRDQAIAELAETMARIVGLSGVLQYDASKPDGAPRKLLDTTRLTALAWTPRTQLAAGIRATYEWFLNNRSQRGSNSRVGEVGTTHSGTIPVHRLAGTSHETPPRLRSSPHSMLCAYRCARPPACRPAVEHRQPVVSAGPVPDFAALKTQLEQVGFCEVRRYDRRETEHAHIDDFAQAYIPHMDKEHGVLVSLNVECRRPAS